ncbi:growth hormone receptor a isoform X1 [Stegostoma tigrinum]|uniref:growth hormone receptor a isoform X1 n=2 Tax=Stegostoma tigrinum TaxID=3053191 RepID=UPI00202ADE8C|nr:growth hormone receptor a isoform X1 [Stegostoma tigrinum]XP_048383610.1 growth hormone receptor a isoform X1 [Stegostoma tigrinum]XP_059500952.1 growth hormone receptor a isoform X1 [Stegostoma tigrinum]
MAAIWATWFFLTVAVCNSAYSSDGPKITECHSADQETFTCSWNVGNFQNLTEYHLKFFYTKGESHDWRECPTYINRETSCYFNQSYTSEMEYCVQLKSDNVTHEQRCFTLDDIVKPDAPISLNWALLNISQSGLFMDIQLWWEDMVSSEPSAGWTPRRYEIQYKPQEAELWKSIKTLPHQHPPQPLYNFATGKEYVVRIRSTYPNIGNFSEFSNILKVFLPASQSVEVPLERPRITECRSPEQETFTCRWSVGNYQNVTERRRLRFFYTKGNNADWKECPKYMHNENACYFNQTYTSIWISYCVQLKSDIQDQNITFDKRCFSIDNIVKPDPPIALNWTLLNISQSGLLADIQVLWEAPPTADIRNGWISLKYEIQYKASESNHWDSIEAFSTSHPVYALSTGKGYEIRLRCKQIANGDFSEFSDLVYVFIPAPQLAEEAGLLFRLILVFVFLGTALMMLLILFTKSQRLKLFFLPPVPVPKINGIDPDLLKKGKIDEVNSIFANHLGYKPDLYIDDPWVEFIDVDLDDPDGKTELLDTDRLLGHEHRKCDNCLSVKDDDSGRDSCYEPDVAEDVTVAKQSVNEFGRLQLETCERKEHIKSNTGAPVGISGTDVKQSQQPDGEECKCRKIQLVTRDSSLSTATTSEPPLHSQLNNQSSFGKMDFYAQVSDITPTGGVLLSPGQQNKLKVSLAKETSLDPKANQNSKPLDSAYTSEVAAKQFCAISLDNENLPAAAEDLNLSNYFTAESLASATVGSYKQTEITRQPTIPVPDYTSIHMVDSQQSLLLNPNVLPSKNQPTLAGYLMPEQLGNVIP